MAKFTQQIQGFILASEGGYVDHKDDPGGATNMGITHKTLSAWRGKPVTKDDVRNLTKAEAMQIYKAQYWDTIHGDDLPEGLDYALADYAINSGPARAVKDLQRELGVGVDGIMGVQTLNAISKASAVKLIEGLTERRQKFVRGISTYSTFGRGWERRIADVSEKARKMAVGVKTGPAAPLPAGEKAPPQSPSATDSILKDPGGLSGIAGAVAAIFGAIADQPILQIAAVIFIGILLYRFVIARKEADPA